MSSGFQVFGPSGEIWLDTNWLTQRIYGSFIVPANSSNTFTFGINDNENPWYYYISSPGGNFIISGARINSTTMQITYETGDSSTLLIHYGTGIVA